MSPQANAGSPAYDNPDGLPAGHPMRQLAATLGLSEPSASGQAPPNTPPGTTAFRQSPVAHRIEPTGGDRNTDSLARPYTLPSGGLLYGDHSGQVLISPMRGEQEEVLAGAGGGLSATPALRHIVTQCLDTRGIPHDQLALEDWASCLLHILAYSMGADLLPLYPRCPACKAQFDGSRKLSQVPHRTLRRCGPGEAPTWPPETSQDEDEDLRILREMGLDGADATAEQVFCADALEEPSLVTLSNGQTIGWRYLRISDFTQAEEFSQRSNDTNSKSPGARLHTFIMSRYISSLDGRAVGVLESMRWVKQAPMSLNRELREHIERRSFGYELSPTFACTECGYRFREQLPLNGAMFRNRSGSPVR